MVIQKSELKGLSEDIEYSLVRRSNMKTVRIRVKADGSVVVSAAPEVSERFIADFIESRAGWIIENVNKAKQAGTGSENEPEITENGRVRIFGRIYTVRIAENSENIINKRGCFENGGELIFFCAGRSDGAELYQMLTNFIAVKCRKFLTGIYDHHFSRLPPGTPKPKIVLKLLKSKWGHCDMRHNEIMFNFLMAKLPADLCEYIVVHEIAHIFVPNHSSDFYDFGEKMLPGFRRLNKELKNYNSNDFMKDIILPSE